MRYLTFLVLLTSCCFNINCNQSKKRISKIENGAYDEMGDPNDAIHKFDTLREEHIIKHLENFLDTNDIKISEKKHEELANWVKEEVFSQYHSYHQVVEWNIDDEDICTKDSLIVSEEKGEEKIIDINICNSILNRGISKGSEWLDPYILPQLHITYSTDVTENLGKRAYYEIWKKDDGSLEKTSKIFTKYAGVTKVYFRFIDNDFSIHDKVVEDNILLYTKDPYLYRD